MTIEEKAKAYDEALEQAKKELRTDLHESGVWALKRIFPELADSEDERIRKEIIDYLGLVGKGKGDYAQPMIDRWIAYLEKLNDFQFNYPGIYFYDGKKLHFQGNPAMEENPYDFAMSQQEEQKPVDSEDKFESIDNAFRRGRETGFREGVESVKQSVEWSEEDEQWLESIIKDYEDSLIKDKDHAAVIKIKIDFLKSLRIHWKPSEQEKGALRTAIYILTNERNFPKAAAQLQNILDAFEGKESRKDWKPSEEQIKALQMVKDSHCFMYQKDRVAIEKLLEQIKSI